MAFPYVKTNWVANVTPLSEANMDHLETQFDDVIALLTIRGDLIYRGAATWERLAKGTEGYYLRQGANDPAWTSVITVATTEVFDGDAPAAFTDLDLSAVVGTNAALVYLKIYNPEAGPVVFTFRANGEVEYVTGTEDGSPSCSNIQATDFGMVIVHTDDAGKVEWKSAAGVGTTVDVVAYIR